MSTTIQITAIGNVGGDPQTTHFEGGGQLTRVSIATTETWKDKNTNEKKELTEWSSIIFKGKLSEIVDKYINKGDKIYIEGKPRTRKWKDQTGNDRWSTEYHATKLVMLTPKGTTQPSASPQSAVDAYHDGSKNQNTPVQNSGVVQGMVDNQDDDLPF